MAKTTGAQGKVNYKIGTMIEVPRAALTADEFAAEAEFMSFGTNDLTVRVCLFISLPFVFLSLVMIKLIVDPVWLGFLRSLSLSLTPFVFLANDLRLLSRRFWYLLEELRCKGHLQRRPLPVDRSGFFLSVRAHLGIDRGTVIFSWPVDPIVTDIFVAISDWCW